MPDAPAIAAAPAPVSIPAPETKLTGTPPPDKIVPPKPVVSKATFHKELEDLDKAGAVNGDDKSKTTPAAKPPEKPAAAKPETEDDLDDEGLETEKPSETKLPDEELPENQKFLKSKPLREAYEKARTEIKTGKETIAKLTEENKRLASVKPVESPDLPKLTQAIADRDKELAELRETVKYLRYEESPEYKRDYVEKYEQVASDATDRAIQLKIVNPDGTGTRNLTKDEFWKIVGTGDENDAVDMAVSIFGEGNPRVAQVIERRNEILKEFQRGENAKKEFRKTLTERESKESEKTLLERQQQNEHSKKVSDTFQMLIKERADSRPEYNQADAGDTKGERLLNAGTALADLMFGRLSPDRFDHLPKSVREKLTPDGKLPADEQIRLHSTAYAAMRERPFIASRLKAVTAELAKVKEELGQYKESEPDQAGGAQRRPKTVAAANWRQELAALDRPEQR